MKNIEQDMALNREMLISMAMFLGSDYTLGIRGVGIVNAMEVVTAFDSIEGLERFKEWAQAPDVFLENPEDHYTNISEKELNYKLQHRNYKKHWELPDDFPDTRVVNAYKTPIVDESKERLSWGKPDFEKLRDLCLVRFKWDENRVDELLKPLEKSMNERSNQKKITDFFLKEEKIAVINSKRITSAIETLQKGDVEDKLRETPVYKSLDNIMKMAEKKKRKSDDSNVKLADYKYKNKRVKKNNSL